MAQPDDLCVCGHPLKEHCFCGCACLHKGEAICSSEESKEMLRNLATRGRTYECREAAEELLNMPLIYTLDCKCTGFKEKE